MSKRDGSILVGTLLVALLGYWLLDRFFYLERMTAKGANVRRGRYRVPYDITLSGSQFSDRDLTKLRHYPAVKNLSLHGSQVSDAGLVEISKLKQLKSLNLAGTAISGAGLQTIQNLENLQILNLSKTSISDDDLAFLHHLPELGHLVLNECENVTLEGLLALKNSRQLRHATVKGLQLDYGDYLQLLEQVPGVQFSVDPADILGQQPNDVLRLEWRDDPRQLTLSVQKSPDYAEGMITREIFAQVPWKENITSLSIHNQFVLSSEALELLPLFTNLENLSIRVDQLTDAGLTAIGKCVSLQSLGLSFDASSENCELEVSRLIQLTQLRSLSISGEQMEVKNLDSLARFNVLQRLTMIKCGLRDPDVSFLQQMRQLELIDFYGNQLTDAALTTFREVTHLMSADLRGNEIDERKLDVFQQALSAKRQSQNTTDQENGIDE